jgi:hypothetical protein
MKNYAEVEFYLSIAIIGNSFKEFAPTADW